MARILIVDDSIIMRRNLKAILTQAGHEIVGEATNGKQAILMYTESRPDLVTMDITMPVMDGVEAVKKITTLFPEAKIVMISAINQKRMVFEALNNGAKHYIIKPITPKKILDIIDKILNLDISVSNKADEIVEEKQEKEVKPPFEIENVDGLFKISLSKSLDTNNFSMLDMAVKGILFIKPLKAKIMFNEIENMDDSLLEEINEIVKKIRFAGGEIEVETKSEAIIEKASKLGFEIFD